MKFHAVILFLGKTVINYYGLPITKTNYVHSDRVKMRSARDAFENGRLYSRSDDNPQLVAFENLEKTYGKQDSVSFFIQPNNKNLFTKENLTKLVTTLGLVTAGHDVTGKYRVDAGARYSFDNDKF